MVKTISKHMDQNSLFFLFCAEFRGPQQGRSLRSQLALCAREEISSVSLRHRGQTSGPAEREGPVVSRWCRQRCSRRESLGREVEWEKGLMERGSWDRSNPARVCSS